MYYVVDFAGEIDKYYWFKKGELETFKWLYQLLEKEGIEFDEDATGMDVYLNCGNLGRAKVNGLHSELEIKTNVGHIELTNVTGPITAKTNTGNITAIFSTVNQSNPISMRTATGDVDVSLSSNTKANLELKTTMGTVYTDFDFKVKKSKTCITH